MINIKGHEKHWMKVLSFTVYISIGYYF